MMSCHRGRDDSTGGRAAARRRAAFSALLGVLMVAPSFPAEAAAPAAKPTTAVPAAIAAFKPRAAAGADHIAIYRQAGQYSAFPILYQLPDQIGTLYVHFGAGVSSSHMEPRREPMSFVSTDGGRTWKKTPRPEPNPAWASAPGRLVVPDAHGWRYVEPARRGEFEARGIEVRDSPDGRVTYAYGCYVRTSDNGGRTWQERELAVPAKGLIMTFLDPATYLRLDARTILRAVYGRPKANDPFCESWLLRSEDDGASWDFSTIAADPEKKIRFLETALARAANGDIVAMMRTAVAGAGTKKMWITRSMDRGRTWTKAVETPLHGHPPHLLTLRDGTMLCTYGYRESPNIGIRAAISRDHGRTWREPDIVSLRDDGTGGNGNNGYPLTAELPDGSFATVYYLTRDNVTGIECTRWKNPWK